MCMELIFFLVGSEVQNVGLVQGNRPQKCTALTPFLQISTTLSKLRTSDSNKATS